MSSTNLNEEAGEECPLCMEPLEMDDLNFFPCTCGYQICRFCWHRIRTDENGLCPACRKAYPENPADFKPLSHEELQRIKQEKRAKDLQRKQKVTENRKHLSNVRVVQKNLVFVVGLSSRLADAETLKKSEYFGKYGKIYKVVINHSTTYAGSQGPSASAYVTYQRAEDALRAIQAVNNIHIDGRTLKASLGTTKYCSHFMKNQQCPKVDCMYLHELGDEAASFTKEEMQQGKHQEFEKKLQDLYLGNPNGSTAGILTPEKPLCNSTSGSVTPGMSESPVLSNPLLAASPLVINNNNNKRSNSSSGKENSVPKIGTQESLGSSSVVREIWPSLNAAANKESKKSRNKGDRGNSSARHTPTEEQNNNHKRGSRERELKECNGDDILEGAESSSPATVTSTSSSGGDSCTSSNSNTPPPQCHPDPAPPLSSPLPVLGEGRGSPPSPTQTPLSSFSSCSEPSSSLPSSSSGGILQQFPPAPPHPPSTGPPILQSPSSNKLPTSNYIFSDNSNSFFSSGHRLPSLQPHHEELIVSNSSLLHNSELTNGHSDTLHSDWRTSTTADLCSQNGVFPLNHTQPWDFDFDKVEEEPPKNTIDDDLGFDPFEETNKALAEDIKIEQKQQEQQRHQMQGNNHHTLSHHHQHHHNHIHSSHQQTINTHQQTEAQLLSLHTGLKSFLDSFPTSSNNSETRLPPPGFNGLTGLNPYGATQQHQQIGKIIPPFYGSNLGNNPSLGSQNITRPINGLVANSNRLNVPPGLSSNILSGSNNSSLSNGLVNNITGAPPTHMPPPSSILGVDSTIGMAPPGLGHPKGDYLIKDIENGIRNMLPNGGGSTSVSTMNTLNTVNTLNSLSAAAPSSSTSQNNPLANFLNLSQHQPQQQQQQQQQQVQHHQQQQQSIFSLPPFNSFSSQKGWSNSAAPDITALDPAIVSSGQLTDSRSDSPPHWLKTMELTGNDGLGHSQWNTMHPYNLVSVGHPSTLGVQAAIPQRSSVWPPTSPPPGFSSISPLHHSKQHQPHKIENL